MKSISEGVVLSELKQMLSVADLASTTEMDLETSLASTFGVSVLQHRSLIKAYVANFVQDQVAEADATNKSVVKRAREGACTALASKAAKKHTSISSAQVDSIALSADELTRCTVQEFKGKICVDIRKFYMSDGERKPSKKGIFLSTPEWHTLAAGLPTLQAALQTCDVNVIVELSKNRRATIFRTDQGKVFVDVRDWYERGGEQKPGSKGVTLSSEELQMLIDHTSSILAQLDGHPTSLDDAPTLKASSEQRRAIRAVDTTVADAAAAGMVTSGADEKLFRLGDDKFATVSLFKGRCYINLRHYYQKDGHWMPSKKGICLTRDQFKELQKHAPARRFWRNVSNTLKVQALSEGLAAKDIGVVVQLSDKRRASVSEFRSKFYVNVREFYEKNGSLVPGSKGIALEPCHWEALLLNMHELLTDAYAAT